MSYEKDFKKYIDLVERKLKEVLPPPGQHPSALQEPLTYAVLSGGKRFRPVITLAACEACGGKIEDALIPAVSIELIHSYSLVHDDLPALDNDELRRGQPTVHKRFGEAIAILTGDGLLTLAFQVLAGIKPAKKAVDILTEISTAAGTYGMIGGQVADLTTDKADLDLPTLDFINVHKTGKLIRASAVAGALAAEADKNDRERMLKYGEFLGLAFQSVDDLMDGDGYLKIMKAREVRMKVRDLIAKAKKEIRALGVKAENLIRLADVLLDRVPKETDVHAPMDS
ncbi:MAG TPA: polyprenyl synthetase family protein [Verrucomicrobiae bacterium]|jgi:geranylgeranyl diphosphate synthase type II|nr:polyprenyl synthetase family protein [Verrucomicrobiae bacterium]